MDYAIYIVLAIPGLLFAGFFVTLLVATILDAWHAYKNKVWLELQRDYTKPKRRAAK